MLGTVDKKLTTYNFRIINCKTEKRLFIIYNSLKETIIYHKEQMKFDIVEIGRYNMIFRMLQLYEYNPQIDWITGLIFTIWHCKNRSISIGRDLIIEDVYKKRNANKFIQIIRILDSIDTSFSIETILEEYQEFILKEY